MIATDLFVYTIFSFLTKRLGRNASDAKFSAVLLLSTVVSFFLINIIITAGIIYDNKISQIFHKGEVISFIIIGILVAIFFCVKYYKYRSMIDIEKRIITTQIKYLKIMRVGMITFVLFVLLWFFIIGYINSID